MPGHCLFFAGGFCVHLNDDDGVFVRERGEFAVDGGEGVISGEGHENPAEEGKDVERGQVMRGRLEAEHEFTWGAWSEVCGARDGVLWIVEEGEDGTVLEGVVAEGDSVDAAAEEFLEVVGRDAAALAGVFAIDDDEGCGVLVTEDGDGVSDRAAASAAYNVA